VRNLDQIESSLLLYSCKAKEMFVWSKIAYFRYTLTNSSTTFKTTAASTMSGFTATCSRFQQHFLSSFCDNILSTTKLQSQTVIREKLHKALSYKKGLSKMLMKLITGTCKFYQHFTNNLLLLFFCRKKYKTKL